jgi:hypothetical protein
MKPETTKWWKMARRRYFHWKAMRPYPDYAINVLKVALIMSAWAAFLVWAVPHVI